MALWCHRTLCIIHQSACPTRPRLPAPISIEINTTFFCRGFLPPLYNTSILCIPSFQLSLPPWRLPGVSPPLYTRGSVCFGFPKQNEVLCLFDPPFFLADKSSCALSTPGHLHLYWLSLEATPGGFSPQPQDSVCFCTADLHSRFWRTNREVQTILAQFPGFI